MIAPAADRRALPRRVMAGSQPAPGTLRRCRGRCRHSNQGIGAIDSLFRSEGTWLARGLARISPASGPAYSQSRARRTLDLSVALPLAIIAFGLIALLILVNRILSPDTSALFRQDRVGKGRETLRVVKIRSMAVRSGTGEHAAPVTVCTAFGRFIRRYYLDELPQLFQVLAGRISLVGIRVLPRNVYDGLADSWSSERLQAWRAMYATAPLGLSGTHQVLRRTGKEDSRRFHHDMFYARRATLGLDLYLLWRTLGSRDTEDRIQHRPGTDSFFVLTRRQNRLIARFDRLGLQRIMHPKGGGHRHDANVDPANR